MLSSSSVLGVIRLSLFVDTFIMVGGSRFHGLSTFRRQSLSADAAPGPNALDSYPDSIYFPRRDRIFTAYSAKVGIGMYNEQ